MCYLYLWQLTKWIKMLPRCYPVFLGPTAERLWSLLSSQYGHLELTDLEPAQYIFFYADIYSIMKSLLKIKSKRSRGWTYSHFIDKTRQRHIFRSSEFLWSQPIKHWLWTIFKHGIWWNKPLFDWNFVFGKKKNILSGLGLRVSLHSKAATEASKEITKLPPKYIAEPFPTDFNASGNSKYAVLQILSAHCQL